MPLFVIPHPLGFEIGPQTVRKACASRVAAVSRPVRLIPQLSPWTTSGLSSHLDCTANLRPQSIAVGLLPVFVVTRATLCSRPGSCLARSPHSTVAECFVRQGLAESSVPEFPFPNRSLDIGSGEAIVFSRAIFPARGGLRRTDIRKTRFGLRHAPDCDLVAVTDRTLSQSAQTAHSFELPFARSIAGSLCRCLAQFPSPCSLPTARAIGSGNLAACEIFSRTCARLKPPSTVPNPFGSQSLSKSRSGCPGVDSREA